MAQTIDEYRSAERKADKARIAELEAAVADVLAYRVGDLPTQGWLRDTDGCRAALAKLAALQTR